MKDYSAMSDFDIQQEVLQETWGKHPVRLLGKMMLDIMLSDYDPCNNPADAWPIIQRNRISLIWVHTEIPNRWDAGSPCHMKWATHQINGLRAAMEVYLMMKDAEKCDG